VNLSWLDDAYSLHFWMCWGILTSKVGQADQVFGLRSGF